MMHIKKDDKVKVLTGKDKGKISNVIAISVKKRKIKVKDVAVVTRHVKARRQGEASGIKKEESYIHISNVVPV